MLINIKIGNHNVIAKSRKSKDNKIETMIAY